MSTEEQYQKSLDIFQKAYNTKKSPISLFYVAACQYELGRFDDALKSLKDFTGKYSSDEAIHSPCLSEDGNNLYQEGRYE